MVCFSHRYIERSHNLYIPQCNGVVSHGAQIRGIPETKSIHDLRALCGISHVFVFTLRSQDIRTLQITVILITGKTRIFLICAPCQDKNGAGSGISLVNLWFLYNSEQWPGQHHHLSCSKNHSPFHNSLVLLHSLTLLTAYMGQGLVTRVY